MLPRAVEMLFCFECLEVISHRALKMHLRTTAGQRIRVWSGLPVAPERESWFGLSFMTCLGSQLLPLSQRPLSCVATLAQAIASHSLPQPAVQGYPARAALHLQDSKQWLSYHWQVGPLSLLQARIFLTWPHWRKMFAFTKVTLLNACYSSIIG